MNDIFFNNNDDDSGFGISTKGSGAPLDTKQIIMIFGISLVVFGLLLIGSAIFASF